MTTAFRSGSDAFPAPSGVAYDRVAFDNLLRRELKVGDPSNAHEVADALMRRYERDPKAIAIRQEAQGMPFLQTASSAPVVEMSPTASDRDWQQAVDDVERDLKELTTSALLKDVTAELSGWREAIRAALREGETSARFGLDPQQRDKAFAIRRQLGDYARLSRLVGAITPDANAFFRQLACSLDEASAVILVRLGESLGNAGFSGGRFLLQTPYTELQVRRDAAIYALRNLTGATQEAYGPSDWPRGLDAYRQLYQWLEDQGLADLRSLLVESELARVMDELIQRAAHGAPDGLRATGATAQIDLARFRRLVIVGRRIVQPESPPFAAFLQAIQLFYDGFTSAGGYRLLRIARPPILLYGLYGLQMWGQAEQRLLTLTTLRCTLAEQSDCIVECGCEPCEAHLRLALDLVLYGLDRAIDLYALGRQSFETPECRASAYAYLCLAVCSPQVVPPTHRLYGTLIGIADALAPFALRATPSRSNTGWLDQGAWDAFFVDANRLLRRRELNMLRELEEEWYRTAQTFGSGCVDLMNALAPYQFRILEQARLLNDQNAWTPTDLFQGVANPRRRIGIPIPPHIETAFDGIVNDVTSVGGGRPGHLDDEDD